MDFIIDAIVEWLKGLLVDGIMGNLDGLFDNVKPLYQQSKNRVSCGKKISGRYESAGDGKYLYGDRAADGCMAQK